MSYFALQKWHETSSTCSAELACVRAPNLPEAPITHSGASSEAAPYPTMRYPAARGNPVPENGRVSAATTDKLQRRPNKNRAVNALNPNTDQLIGKLRCIESYSSLDLEIKRLDEPFEPTVKPEAHRNIEARAGGSMGGRGRWVDNLFVERLWRNVKYEDVYLRAYVTPPTELRAGLARHFAFYNTRRRYSALGRRAPDAVYYDLTTCERVD